MTLVGIIQRRMLAAAALVIATGALALALKSGMFGDQPAARSQPSCSGPWSECSKDAQWLRQVLAEAGFPDPGPGTGSALVIPSESISQRFFWATRPLDALDPSYSPYDAVPRVGDIRIYGDHVRLVWRVQDRNVWVEPPPDRKLLAELVRLTQVMPAPTPKPSDQHG